MNSGIKRLFSVIFLVVVVFNLQAQQSLSGIEKGLHSITEKSLKAQLTFLSSDWFEGRETATNGAHKAADYIASQFGAFELEPYFENSYFQNIDFIVSENGKAHISLTKKEDGASSVINFNDGIDYSLSRFFSNKKISGNLVFGYYGLSLDKWKDAGNILLRVKGFSPEDSIIYSNMNERKLLGMKNEAAVVAGFSAILEIDQDFVFSKNQDDLVAPAEKELNKYSSGIYKKGFDLVEFPRPAGIPVIRISSRMADQLLPAWRKLLNTPTDKKKSFPVADGTIIINFSADQEIKNCRNVLAVIEGELTDEVLVVGAHYDHLGKYDGYIWNGADDNGTGAIGVVAIARAFKETGIKPKRTVVFATWTGEERGLFGSSYFVKSHQNPNQIKCYHNYDMIGREGDLENRDMKVSCMYSAVWPKAEEVVKAANEVHELGLDIRYAAMKNPAAGSDNASFARIDIPMMWFHTGGHPDYHGPFDHADKINYKKMSAVVKTSFIAMWNLANE